MGSSRVRGVAIARLVWLTFGRVLFGRASAIASGVGLVAAILFSPQGLQAADVVRWTDAGPWSRLGLFGFWLALAVPPVGAALRAPGAKLVRSLPLSPTTLASSFFGLVLALHAPLALLYARGAGVLRAAATSTLSLACVALLVAPRRAWPFALAPLALLFAPPAVGLAAGAPLAVVACAYAWRHGAEPHALASVPLPRSAPLAIAASYVLLLARRERVRAAWAIAALFAGRAASALLVTNGAIGHESMALSPFACVATGLLAPPLLAEAARLAWVSPRPWAARAVAAALVLGVASALAGPAALLAAPLAAWSARDGARHALAVLAWSAVSGALAWRLTC